MLIRAGASNREMIGALGINIQLLYTLVFGFSALWFAHYGLAALAALRGQAAAKPASAGEVIDMAAAPSLAALPAPGSPNPDPA